METRIQGYVRKSQEYMSVEGEGQNNQQVALSPLGDVLIARGTPDYQEVVRGGRSFFCSSSSVLNAVIARPTTQVIVGLYNAAPPGGPTAIIDFVSACCLTSGAAASQAMMWVYVGQHQGTPPTTTATFNKMNGNGSRGAGSFTGPPLGSVMLGGFNQSVDNVADAWFPVGIPGVKTGVAATPGYGMYYECNGRFMVPPGRWFGTHVLSSAVSEQFMMAVGWHERQLNLG